MAQPQPTTANIAGLRIRDALSEAFDKYGISKTTKNYREGLINPILNLYPNAVNLSAAALETGAGLLGSEYNAGRMPLYRTGPFISPLITGDSQNEDTQIETEPPEPKPTLANRDLNSEYYGGFDNVPVRKAKPITEKLYRVMYAGKGAESSEVYETKEEADAALKKAGGKGAVAGIDMSRKAKDESKVSNRNYLKGELGEKLSADETEARKQKYIDQLAQTKMDKMVYDEQLSRAKSPEYKEQLRGRVKAANEAKLAEDKKVGAEFASWTSNVKARRESENQLNFYNNQLGLLKQAYSQARQAGDPITALAINQAIRSYTAGVPKEMGARKAAAEKGIITERNKMLAEKMQAAQEEEAKKSKTAAANPDYNQYNQGNVLIARKPVGF
jgi:hypothetical protein